jgi:hypothetical protein
MRYGHAAEERIVAVGARRVWAELVLGALRAERHGRPSHLVREQDAPRLAGLRRPAALGAGQV